jgi:hypothetical protein
MREKFDQLSSSRRFLLLLVLAPLFLAGLCQVAKAGHYLLYRGDSTFPESAVVQTALWSEASGRVYPGLEQSPYTPAPYGPLFYAGLTALAKLFHADFDHLLVYGRGVTFGAFLLLVFAGYLWGRRRGLAAGIALMGPALILAQIDFESWNASVRPDVPALLVCFAAFFALTTAPVTWRRALLAGILCGIAGLLKQSFIALPLAALFWLVTTRQRRAALAFLGGMVAVAIAVFAPLALRHEPFLREMLLARYSPISFSGALKLVETDFLNYPGQLAFLGLGVLGLLRMDPKAVPARPLIATYFCLAWLTNFYTSMAPGASMNAFLEAWVVTCVCASFAFQDLVENWERTAATARMMVLLLWLVIMAADLDWWRVLVSIRPPSEYATLAQAVRGRRVLSDLPYVSAHGVQPELLDPSVNHYLEIAGQWSPAPLLEELQSGRFDYVIVGLSEGRARQWRGLTLFSISILKQVDANYRPLCVAGRFAVYVPRSRAIDYQTEDFKKAGCNAATASDRGADPLEGIRQR